MSLASDTSDKLASALRKAGVRVTKQRIALLAVLGEADDHSLATVYRTLSVLEAEGVVHRHAFEGGGARFETADEAHHDHIVDLDSGEVIEFHSAEIEKLQEKIAAEMGYEVVHHRMELYCKKKSRT